MIDILLQHSTAIKMTMAMTMSMMMMVTINYENISCFDHIPQWDPGFFMFFSMRSGCLQPPPAISTPQPLRRQKNKKT